MRGILAWALGALFLMGLGGCAGKDTSSLSESQARRTIQAALTDIEDIYYRETKAAELVGAGLEEINVRYPTVEFSRRGEAIVATVEGNSVDSLAIQNDKGASEKWAEQLTPMLVQIAAILKGDDKPDLEDLTDTFLGGITNDLDPFTGYKSRREARTERQRFSGKPGTLAIRVKREARGLRIVQVYIADALGSGLLRQDDLIVEIDGVPTIGINEDTFQGLIRGAVGSPVVVKILRSNDEVPVTVPLQREKDDANAVAVFREGDIQRIVVVRFHGRMINDLRDLLYDLKNDLQPAKGIILDLRNNPGGLLDSTVSAADFFLSEGRILTTQGRHSDSHQNFVASSAPPEIDQPLVVLVDQSSAAGSEIVAAALQDNGRAVVVGTATFGKGTIQTFLPMPNQGIFGITWTEIYTPANYRLEKRGVMPTVCTGGDVTAEAILADLRRGAGVIDQATRTQDIDPDDDAAVAAFRSLCPPRSDGDDISLEVAEAILADPALYAGVLGRERQTLHTRTAGN
ncbi:S41 family peptidase [Pelagibius sp. 7325]|uniref:S41 family peptidase n=1 Tax=Pelagibius sp. 7325 TaxID=3131994 RepID=UPI0030EE3A20